MFGNNSGDISLKNTNPSALQAKSKSIIKSRQHSKNKRFRERLIYLFGSPLDDIEIKKVTVYSPRKLNKNRRHSLPVSINILNKDFLQPLKISQKRKSENDATLTSSTSLTKLSKIELKSATQCELPETNFNLPSEFVEVEINLESVFPVTVLSERSLVLAVAEPNVKAQQDTKVINNNLIDLTETKSSSTLIGPQVPRPMAMFRNEVKVEVPFQSSERANNVPGMSMPLLSSVSSAESTQLETVLPGTTTQANKTTTSRQIVDSECVQTPLSQRPPPTGGGSTTTPVPTGQGTAPVPSDGTLSVLQEIMKQCSAHQKQQPEKLKQTVGNKTISSSRGVCHMPQKPQTSAPTTTQQPRSIFPRPTTTTMNTTNKSYSPQQSAPLKTSVLLQQLSQIQPSSSSPQSQQQSPPYQEPFQNLNQQNPPAPRLIRLNISSQDSYHLLSNVAFVDRVFPHIYMYSKWRGAACNNCQIMNSFLPPQLFKEIYSTYYAYVMHITKFFGKLVIYEMSTVDVDKFNLNEILTLLTNKLQEKSIPMNIFRVSMYLDSLLRQCGDICTTPFTQKFLKHVQLTREKMERKSQAAAAFLPGNFLVLEKQIQQYVMISNWVNTQLRYSVIQKNPRMTSRNAPSQHTSPMLMVQLNQTSQKQSQEALRQTVLQDLLTGVPDRQGNNDNIPCNAFNKSIPNNTNVPQRSTPTTYPHFSLQVQDTVQPAPTPSQIVESSSLVPSTNGVPPVESSMSETRYQSTTTVVNSIGTREIVDLSTENLPSAKVENDSSSSSSEDVIDLTWIDDGDEAAIIEEMENHTFPFKGEMYNESDTGREVVSPADSGLGSPRSQVDGKDDFRCLCGEKAVYVCACNCSMYCSRICQINDWSDHQKWCQLMKN